MNISVPILDKEYSISCLAESKDELYASVADLQAICKSIQLKNPEASVDKVLVVAAINFISQASFYREEVESLTKQIEQLRDKVELLD